MLLTGRLSDGAAGLHEIRERGGLAIVQHPVEARR
ncbi:chemotaxis protein CheB, partial [Methylobacterium frigidaeris]